jgi:hypothetical protein
MKEQYIPIIALVLGIIIGFSYGFYCGEDYGWWKCFKVFEKHRRK